MNEVIPLEKKGDYLYAYLDEFTNDKLLEKTTDVSFAKNNDFGEVIDGCEYDKKTKTIKQIKNLHNKELRKEKKRMKKILLNTLFLVLFFNFSLLKSLNTT